MTLASGVSILDGKDDDDDVPSKHSAADIAAVAAMMAGMARTAVHRPLEYTAGVAR